MEQTGQLILNTQWQEQLKNNFCSACVTDDEMCDALRKVISALNYVADPHTAVAMAAAEKLGFAFLDKASTNEGMPLVILATASPCKFEAAIAVAFGQDGWNCWEAENFPARAREIFQKDEKETFCYS